MGYGRREEVGNRKQLNLGRVFIVAIVLIVAIVSIVLLVKNVKKEDTSKKENNQNHAVDVKKEIEEKAKNEYKTIEQMLEEFGGEISDQLDSTTYYIQKSGATYTAYVNDQIVEGKIVPWTGESKEPEVDSAGNINIYSAEELKWIADQVINGTKNFSGVTITLRQDIDLGARRKEDGSWEGKEWSSIIGFLDEMQKSENATQEQSPEEAPVEDDTIDITNENLKRFAGIFDGNNHSVRGLYINNNKRYQGLFGVSSGIIQNLSVKNSCIIGGTGASAIVGLNGGKILNCAISNVEVRGTTKTGGIAGIGMTGSWIENCITSDNSTVYGGNYTGGIVGYANNNSAIIRCENEALVSGNNFVGGNAGIAFYGTTVESSSNHSSYINGEKYVGGIIGYSQAQIEKCANTTSLEDGYIKGTEFIGGIVGLNYTMGNIENSYNTAKVIVTEDNAGGVVGLNNSNISSCYNTGMVDASECAGAKVGGLCGQNVTSSFIESSYSVGKVVYNVLAQGLVGTNYGALYNSYYLDSAIDTINEKYAKNAEQLKNTILNESKDFYKEDSSNINSGFPILNWQG